MTSQKADNATDDGYRDRSILLLKILFELIMEIAAGMVMYTFVTELTHLALILTLDTIAITSTKHLFHVFGGKVANVDVLVE